MEGATIELLEKRKPQVVVGAGGEAEVDVRLGFDLGLTNVGPGSCSGCAS